MWLKPNFTITYLNRQLKLTEKKRRKIFIIAVHFSELLAPINRGIL